MILAPPYQETAERGSVIQSGSHSQLLVDLGVRDLVLGFPTPGWFSPLLVGRLAHDLLRARGQPHQQILSSHRPSPQQLHPAGGCTACLLFPPLSTGTESRTALPFGFSDCATVGEIGLK